MSEILGYSSGIIMMCSAIPYVRDILRGKTKPERATWFIWSILMVIAFFSQWAKGATFSNILTIGDTMAILVVFFLSIKHGVGGITKKRDKFALIGAGISLVLWYLTKEPAVALLIIIFIDFLGGSLTILKAYEDPESETMVAWFIAGFAGLLGTLSVGEMNFILLAFPFYIFLINTTIGITIFLGKRKNRSK